MGTTKVLVGAWLNEAMNLAIAYRNGNELLEPSSFLEANM